jgi:hypothetical protein
VIDNYSEGGNDPHFIDSISRIATARKTAPAKPAIIPPVVEQPVVKTRPVVMTRPAHPIQKEPQPVKPLTIDELFTTRKKVFTTEIPIKAILSA